MAKFNLDYINKNQNSELFPFYKNEYWHSGIHINDSSMEIYTPVSCTIEAYKIEEDSFTAELPGKMMVPQEELGSKIEVINEGEKNTLEYYHLPDSDIPIYELYETAKGKKFSVGSTNYLLLKYKVNNLEFYLLFVHLDPYKRYLTKGTNDNWINLKSFTTWAKVPFYISWKIKIDNGCQSKCYVFKNKYPPRVSFISSDESFFKKEFNPENSNVKVIFNGDKESDSLDVNAKYLTIEDKFKLIRKAASELMLYEKDGNNLLPKYILNEKGFGLTYSISDNAGNTTEYRQIQIPECGGTKENPEKRNLYHIGFLPKAYLNNKTVKKSCYLRYPVLYDNNKLDVCCFITEEEAKEKNIQLCDDSKIEDKYLVMNDNYQLYPTGLTPLNFILPTQDVFLSILSTDENDSYFHKVSLKQLCIYISEEDVTEKTEDNVTEYTVNAELKNPVYLVDAKYPINFDCCKSRLPENDFKEELNRFKIKCLGLNGEKIKGKKVEYDNRSENSKVLEPSESDVSKEVSVDKKYKRFIIKNINDDYEFYIHEKELKNKTIDEENKICKFSEKKSKPFLIEIYEKPFEEIEYLFIKDDKNIAPIKVTKAVYNTLKKEVTKDIEIYCMKKRFCLCKGINNVEDFKYDKEYENKGLWDKINNLDGIKAVQVTDYFINGKAYVKESEVEFFDTKQSHLLPHGILTNPTLPLAAGNSDWHLKNNIAVKYQCNDVTSKFLGFINLSTVNEINCDSPEIGIEENFIQLSSDLKSYSIYFENQDDLDKCYISNYFNEKKIENGLSISPSDFIGHGGNFLGEKEFFHFSLFLNERPSNVKAEYFILDENVTYYDYRVGEKAKQEGAILIPSNETVFHILDRYGDFYKVKIESLHLYVHEKDLDFFGHNKSYFVIDDPTLTKKKVILYPRHYFYIYDKALKMRYEEEKYCKGIFNLMYEKPTEDSEYSKSYDEYRQSLIDLGRKYFTDYTTLKIIKDYNTFDGIDKTYKKVIVSNTSNNWSFWVNKSEIGAYEEGNKLKVKYNKPTKINIYSEPATYEFRQIKSPSSEYNELKSNFPIFTRTGVEETLNYGPFYRRSVSNCYRFSINEKNVYIMKLECDSKSKRKEIKWDDFFHYYETDDKKLLASLNSLKRIGERVKDSSEICKILCKIPFDYNSDLYTEDNYPESLTDEQYAFYKNIFDNMAFDNSLFKKAIFSNPMYFLKTCNELGMFEFNPYEGLNYKELYNYTDETDYYIYEENGVKRDYEFYYVKSSPGITAEYSGYGKFVKGINCQYYAGVNGFFNAQYLKEHSGYKEYWHEGVDFRAPAGTTIYSLINGKVVRCGSRPVDRNGQIQGFILLQSLRDENLFYLALHVDKDTLLVKNNQIVTPETPIGHTMLLKNSLGNDVSHLHVSVIKLPEGINPIGNKGIVTLDNRFPIWGDFQTPNQEIWTNMINPFNYNDINTWKGCYK